MLLNYAVVDQNLTPELLNKTNQIEFLFSSILSPLLCILFLDRELVIDFLLSALLIQ